MNKLYVYEHCPYCTKARMIFGLKQIDVEVQYLAYDDHQTPESLSGVKMLPIWMNQESVAINESLDIINFVEEQYFPALLEKKVEPFIQAWLTENSSLIYKLCMPRWAKSDLPEFQSFQAREYFCEKKESSIGSFQEHLNLTEDYLEMLYSSLESLSTQRDFFDVDQRPLQLGDIHLFASLKALTIVKDIVFPQNIEVYIQKISVQSKVPTEASFSI